MQSGHYKVDILTKLNPFRKKYKVVLCIHGGAGWCMGYWGALWFLLQKGIVPVGFVARSSGAFIALSYAFGWNDQQGRDYYRGFNLTDYFKDQIRIPLFDVNKYHKFTGRYSDKISLDHLKLPIYLTTVNQTDHQIEYLLSLIHI